MKAVVLDGFGGLEVLKVGEAVNSLIKQKRVSGRNVPGKSVSLTHYEGYRAQVFGLKLPWDESKHSSGSSCGMEQTGKHFEGRRLAGAVGAKKANYLAWGDSEADALDSRNLTIFTTEKAANCSRKTRFALGHLVGLAQYVD